MRAVSAGLLARVQRIAAAQLTDTCAILRATGAGLSATVGTAATGVPCRHEPPGIGRAGDLAGIPGGLESVAAEVFYFAPEADVRVQDTLLPASGGKYLARARAAMTDAAVLTVWTERRE